MRKEQLFALSILVLLLMASFVGLSKVSTVKADPNYDRTGEMGILISAWTMDSHGITPSQCKAMIDNVYSSKGVSFAAVKITYGFDPNNGAQYTADRLGVWVDYFDDYYSTIYVASRSVFHIERKLTSTEYTDYYSRLATELNGHSAVKCFIGEEEPEAKQVDPYTGDPEGNNLAYSSFADMMNYITVLHDTWHQYSNIPFSFESIPSEGYDGNGNLFNNDCWFNTTVNANTYWQWIVANQDIFAIDEWRYHVGVAIWADFVWGYNIANNPDRKIIIGESFNLNVVQTEQLWDAFKHDSLFENDLAYAFWWMLAGSEPVSSENQNAPEPYVYFDGGFKGHCWAFLNMQTVSPNNVAGSGVASAMTYSDNYDDTASAEVYVGGNSYPEETCYVIFNLDMSADRGYGGNDVCLGYWGNGYSYYAVTAHYNSVGSITLNYYYPDIGNPYCTDCYSATCVVPNCWNWASMTTNYWGEITFTWGYENPETGSITNTVLAVNNNGYADSIPISIMAFGAMGGQKVKLYVGAIGMTDVCGADFDLQNGMSGWSLIYSEPSMVQQSGLLVPSNGAMWMVQRVRYNVDY